MLEPVIGLCAVLLTGAYCVTHREKLKQRLLFSALEEDADIKIANGSFSAKPSQEELAEQAARQFLRQKEAGNIDKARALGKLYAQTLVSFEQDPPQDYWKGKTMQQAHHQLLLLSYAISRVIAEYSPNSILAQTSLNVFYSEIESCSPTLHKHVSDMAAFSLYILCERSRRRSEDDIGQVYAKLCGFEGIEAYIDEGNRVYKQFFAFCAEKIKQIDYVELP